MVGLHSIASFVKHDSLDRLAVVAAVVAFVAVKSTVRRWCRVKPYGPLVYTITKKDFGVAGFPWRHLFGETIAQFSLEPGKALGVWHAAAKETLHDERAVVLMWAGSHYAVHLVHEADVRAVHIDHPDMLERSQLDRVMEPLIGKHSLICSVTESTHTEEMNFVLKAFGSKKIRRLLNTSVHDNFKAFLSQLQRHVASSSSGAGPTPICLEEVITEQIRDLIIHAVLGAENAHRGTNLMKYLMYPMSPLLALGPEIYNRLPVEKNAVAQAARAEVLPAIEAFHAAAVAKGAAAGGAGADEDDEELEEGKDGSSRDDAKPIAELLSRCAGISVAQTLDHSITVTAAAFESTASMWNWTLYYLTHSPAAQETLFDELRHVVPKDTVPMADTVAQLPYLNAVIREALRMTCPAALLSRTAARDIVLPGSGTFVPKGENVVVSMIPLHRNKDVYGENADEYDADRWVRDPELYERVRGRYYYPFGLGSRSCIGAEMALGELRMGVALVVRNFKLTWPEGQALPGRKQTIAIHPTSRCVNILEPRGL